MSEEKKTTEQAKASRSNLAGKDYILGRDIGQKVLYVIVLLGALPSLFPKLFLGFLAIPIAVWFLASSFFGYLVLVSAIMMACQKKSEALMKQENPKRFLNMSPRTWNWIVGIPLAALLIVDLIKDFEFINIIVYLFVFIISYGLLTKNATVKIGKPDPNKVGSPAWKEANEVQRVHVSNSQYPIWRDKNGNYYESRFGSFHAIPTPVEIINKNKK